MQNKIEYLEKGKWVKSGVFEDEKLIGIVCDCLEAFDYQVRVIPVFETSYVCR